MGSPGQVTNCRGFFFIRSGYGWRLLGALAAIVQHWRDGQERYAALA
jgi:hypothetical protein